MLLARGEPQSETELESLLKFYKHQAESFLRESPLLNGLDLDNDNHEEKICDCIAQNRETREYSALRMLIFSQMVEENLENGNIHQAVWGMYQASLSHCFFEVGDYDFEETLWQGHEAHKFLASVQDASLQTPAQDQAIEELRSLFDKQSEVILHTWVEDGKPIGERIGISGLPEETLKALARYYLNQFDRKRQEAQQAKEDKRKEEEARRQNQIGWNPVLIACISLCTAILISLVNKFIPPR